MRSGIPPSRPRVQKFLDTGIHHPGLLVDESMAGVGNDFNMTVWQISAQSGTNRIWFAEGIMLSQENQGGRLASM